MRCRAGLHGAAVVITGRRPAVLQEAVQALQREGIRAHGIQVLAPRGVRGAGPHPCTPGCPPTA